MTQESKQFRRTEDGHLILMTPEERKLLITDLTSRIDYGVICMIERVDDFGPRWRNEKLTGFVNEEDGCFYFDFGYGLTVEFAEKVKPYLRPMSSMTEEEKKEFSVFGFEVIDHINANRDECPKYQVIEVFNFSGITEITDWLNKHHFDYRGLIEKGLALEAPEGMYNTK